MMTMTTKDMFKTMVRLKKRNQNNRRTAMKLLPKLMKKQTILKTKSQMATMSSHLAHRHHSHSTFLNHPHLRENLQPLLRLLKIQMFLILKLLGRFLILLVPHTPKAPRKKLTLTMLKHCKSWPR